MVTREEKYKAKLAIDSVIQRLGDTVAAAAFEILGAGVHKVCQIYRCAHADRCVDVSS